MRLLTNSSIKISISIFFVFLFSGLNVVGCSPTNKLAKDTLQSDEIIINSALSVTSIPTILPLETAISQITIENKTSDNKIEKPTIKKVIITGWMSIVWNDEPRFYIYDESEKTTQLLIEDMVAKPYGGVLELDRKKITIIGELENETSNKVRVIEIQEVVSQ